MISVGTWAGNMTDPKGRTSVVSYKVKIIGDSLSITLISQALGSYPLDNIRIDKQKLSFIWIPDMVVNCSLDSVSTGGYEGTCLDSNGGKWRLTMIPPKTQSFLRNQ